MTSFRVALTAALSAGIVFFACMKKEETASTATTSQSTATVVESTTTAAPPPATTTSSAAAVAPQGATAGAIASTEGEKPGARIDITELKRTSGGTLNLKFALVNNSDKRLGVSSEWLGDHSLTNDSYRNVSGIHLLDPVNKKKYFVVTDAERKCVCSTDVADVEPGQKVNLWAKFPAPPADVQRITIVVPHFAPIDDVPIQ